MTRFLFSVFWVALATSCWQPIYEDLTESLAWTVCCVDKKVDTCPCEASLTECQNPFVSCAAGACVLLNDEPPLCQYSSLDAGVEPPDGGSADLGDAGNLTKAPRFQPCCTTEGRVSTCLCEGEACAPFVACAQGRCVTKSSTARCPN